MTPAEKILQAKKLREQSSKRIEKTNDATAVQAAIDKGAKFIEEMTKSTKTLVIGGFHRLDNPAIAPAKDKNGSAYTRRVLTATELGKTAPVVLFINVYANTGLPAVGSLVKLDCVELPKGTKYLHLTKGETLEVHTVREETLNARGIPVSTSVDEIKALGALMVTAREIQTLSAEVKSSLF